MDINERQVAEFTYDTICRTLSNHFINEVMFVKIEEGMSAAAEGVASATSHYKIDLRRISTVSVPEVFFEGTEITVSCHIYTICLLKKAEADQWECNKIGQLMSWVHKLKHQPLLSGLAPADISFLNGQGIS